MLKVFTFKKNLRITQRVNKVKSKNGGLNQIFINVTFNLNNILFKIRHIIFVIGFEVFLLPILIYQFHLYFLLCMWHKKTAPLLFHGYEFQVQQ